MELSYETLSPSDASAKIIASFPEIPDHIRERLRKDIENALTAWGDLVSSVTAEGYAYS